MLSIIIKKKKRGKDNENNEVMAEQNKAGVKLIGVGKIGGDVFSYLMSKGIGDLEAINIDTRGDCSKNSVV